MADNAGYAVMRQGKDFTDEELGLTVAVQPVLMALHRALAVRAAVPNPAVAARFGLTRAELDVLRLVDSGMTAVAIGHARGISARTVRKHLEGVYRKLGRHDRLQAVLYARQLGLLPEGAGPPAPGQ